MLNPDCGDPYPCDNSKITLVHVQSIGPNDELHYLWDFTGTPAALLLRFDGHSSPVNMTIDWGAFFDGKPSIKFSREPKFYFGIVLQSLFVYNDRTGEAQFNGVTDPADIIEFPLHEVQWSRDALEVSDDKAEVRVSAQKMIKGRHSKKISKSLKETLIGNINLTFSTYGLPGHSEKIPHLLHTENSTEIDVVLQDIVGGNFSCSRLAMGVTVVAMDDVKRNFSLNIRRSIDDEFTPGIFELINLSSTGGKRGEGFLQYRPVSYTDAERDVATSTLVRQSDPQHVDDQADLLQYTIVGAVDGIVIPKVLVESMNVSFGVKDDGCFAKTNYTTWTFIAAYGQPMAERLSTMVVVLAALGLGIPLILLISGGCFVCLRKARQ